MYARLGHGFRDFSKSLAAGPIVGTALACGQRSIEAIEVGERTRTAPPGERVEFRPEGLWIGREQTTELPEVGGTRTPAIFRLNPGHGPERAAGVVHGLFWS